MAKRPRRKTAARKKRRGARKAARPVRKKARSTPRRRRPLRSKPRISRKHTVRARFNVPQLTKAGSSLSLKVYAEEQKVGDITIGRGSLWWRGGHRQKMKRISWSDFAEMMDRLAYR